MADDAVDGSDGGSEGANDDGLGRSSPVNENERSEAPAVDFGCVGSTRTDSDDRRGRSECGNDGEWCCCCPNAGSETRDGFSASSGRVESCDAGRCSVEA